MQKRKYGIAGTLLFHGILIALLIFFGFSTPLPLPEEEGILVNFGTAGTGSGQTEPVESEPARSEPAAQPAAATQKESPVITQDYEEAPVIEKKSPVKKKTTVSPTEPKTEKKQSEEPVKEEPVKEEQKEVVNTHALYTGKNPSGNKTGEGTTTEKGNQGSITGSEISGNHTEGSSSGTKGIDYSLAGRNPLSLPKPAYNYQVEGKVVVEVTVDRFGHVTNAVAGVRGSTTLDENLLNAAKKAALLARFDTKPDAPAYQKGTITYYFMLQ
jgi:TonB family protein